MTSIQGLRKIIVDNYNKFKGKLQVRLKVPENVKNYIQLTLDSECVSKEVGDNHEIICNKVSVTDWKNFSLKIKLDREVCNRGLSRFQIEVSVFGQKDSTLPITVGEIPCGSGTMVCRYNIKY